MQKDLIVETCKAEGLLRNQAAYVLATTEWETAGSFEPVEEGYYLGGKKAENYRKKLRYYPWYGRGFVQLTWKANYEKAGNELGVDLITDPSRALEPDIAAKVLVVGMKRGWFTGLKLSDYITLRRSDFKGARKIVNGTDRDDDIAELAVKHDHALLAAGYGVEGRQPKPAPLPTQPKPGKPAGGPSKSIWGILLDLFLKLVEAIGKRLGKK